jgi:AcrR family transcriptional regulator
MGVAERRLREKEEMRSKILEAAAELFVQEGYDSVSMRRIADRIEYSPSTIYLYFKDKSHLCSVIVAETFDKLRLALEKIVSQPIGTEERLRRCLRTYIQFGLDNPKHYIFSLCTPEPPLNYEDGYTEQVKQATLNSGLAAFDYLRRGIAQSMEEGIIRRQDVELAAQVTWAMLHGLTSLLITTHSFPFLDRELLIDTLVDQIVRGLK